MSFNPQDYIYSHSEVSDNAQFKYKAVLKKRSDTNVEAYVWYGDKTKDHLRDRTRLNAFPQKGKGKRKIRKDYIDENKGDPDFYKKYSKFWFERMVLY